MDSTLMDSQHLQTACNDLLSDPERIALESIGEQTNRFIFDDAMLLILQDRGLVEPLAGRWRVTRDGQRVLNARLG